MEVVKNSNIAMVNKLNQHFFFTILIGVIVLTVFIFLPYFSAIMIAIVLGVLLRPLHDWLRKFIAPKEETSTIAALVSVVVIVVVVLTPLFFLGLRISSEAQSMYAYLTNEGSRTQIVNTLDSTVGRLARKFVGASYESFDSSFNVTTYAKSLLHWGFTNIDSLFSKAAVFVMNLIVIMFALYFILRDGKALKRQLISLSPLPDKQDEQIFTKLNQAVHSVVWGSLAVGLIQGVLTGIGFAVFGVPSPALWGSIAVIASLVPGIGTSLVLVPGVIYLFATGQTGQAFGLLAWGVIAVGLIDNFLGPILMKRGVHVHQFLILLSVLGGLSFFGPIGFIAGPLVLSLLFALLEIYKENLRNSSQE